MQGVSVAAAVIGIVLASFLARFDPVFGAAQVSAVDCDQRQSLTDALLILRAGDTLRVNGTCLANVVIDERLTNVTLDGQGTAVINPADPTAYTITVRGRGITIRGFTINGGTEVVYIQDGGAALIDGNTIQGGLNGVFVTRSSSAHIVNNTIQGNSEAGILINENSSARIGFLLSEERTASPNAIQFNGTSGITVTRSSNARIVGNSINDNRRDGVSVNRLSVAEISANVINANGGDGIAVSHNSGVHLGRDTGTGIMDLPNSGENAGVGVRCTIGGYADGRIGPLDRGDVNFDTGSGPEGGCINSLVP